jgi:hypothetical protein
MGSLVFLLMLDNYYYCMFMVRPSFDWLFIRSVPLFAMSFTPNRKISVLT